MRACFSVLVSLIEARRLYDVFAHAHFSYRVLLLLRRSRLLSPHFLASARGSQSRVGEARNRVDTTEGGAIEKVDAASLSNRLSSGIASFLSPSAPTERWWSFL